MTTYHITQSLLNNVARTNAIIALNNSSTTINNSIIIYFDDKIMNNPFLEVLTYIARGHDVFDVYAYVFGGGRAMTAIFLSIFLSLLNIVFSFGVLIINRCLFPKMFFLVSSLIPQPVSLMVAITTLP